MNLPEIIHGGGGDIESAEKSGLKYLIVAAVVGRSKEASLNCSESNKDTRR